jgi:hypothetical protein
VHVRLLSLLGLLVSLAGAAAAGAGPRLVIAEPLFEFGAVERGIDVVHAFRLRNEGDATLHVHHVKGSCGCTVAAVSPRDLPPGAEGWITLRLDTARLAGRTTKAVTVYTDDPQLPIARLTLSGEVRADVVVMPHPLYLGRVRRGEAVRREVEIMSGRPAGTHVATRVEADHPALRLELAPADPAGQRLAVALDPEVPLGRFDAHVTIHTTSPREPRIDLPVFGSIEGDVLVLPPEVTFSVAGRGPPPERELYIRNRSARPFAVTRVAAPTDMITYALTEVERGREYLLRVRLRNDLRPGRVEGKLEIFTDLPEHRVVVPVYAIVRGTGRRG